MKHDILYLGSQSRSRHKLLKEAAISFKVLTHTSDEALAYENIDFLSYVLSIAQHKMSSLVLPDYQEINNEHLFVLTADSLVKLVNSNQIFGKPVDHRDAYRMLRLMRDEPAEVATGCCLEKKIWDGTAWQTHDARSWTTTGIVEFIVDEDAVDEYFKRMPHAYASCGAGIIEGFGESFFKSIQGSYTAVKGLPIFELRQTLRLLGFRLLSFDSL